MELTLSRQYKRLRRIKMLKLLRRIACAICQNEPTLEAYDNWVRQQVGDIPRYQTTWGQVKAELDALGLECMIKNDAPDFYVYHTDEVSLARMAPYLTYPADYYTQELDIDCDDYAMWSASDARRIFKVNGIYQCFGDMPDGYHAFPLAKVGVGEYKIWDSNAGFLCAGKPFNFGDYDYQPRKWK